eukprot:scaffold7065_cov73-Cyclotella_meneghiniana.AAC.1
MNNRFLISGSRRKNFCSIRADWQLETAGAVNRHAIPSGRVWESGVRSEERESWSHVIVRVLIVDPWWTKKDPFAAVLEGEVVGLRLRR